MCANLIKTIQIEQKDKFNCAFLIFWSLFWAGLWLLRAMVGDFWGLRLGTLGGESLPKCVSVVLQKDVIMSQLLTSINKEGVKSVFSVKLFAHTAERL